MEKDMLSSVTFTISEPICKAYSQLFLRDFSKNYLAEVFFKSQDFDATDFDYRYGLFNKGLMSNRLELAGNADDLAGWLVCYIEAYIDPDFLGVSFDDWDALSPDEKEDVCRDVNRLSPMLRKTLNEMYAADRCCSEAAQHL